MSKNKNIGSKTLNEYKESHCQSINKFVSTSHSSNWSSHLGLWDTSLGRKEIFGNRPSRFSKLTYFTPWFSPQQERRRFFFPDQSVIRITHDIDLSHIQIGDQLKSVCNLDI